MPKKKNDRLVRHVPTTLGFSLPVIFTKRNLTSKSRSGSLHHLRVKWCVECGQERDLLDFLVRLRKGPWRGKDGTLHEGYTYLCGGIGEDHRKCFRHFDVVVIEVPAVASRDNPFKFRIDDLRDESGRPVGIMDSKSGKWRKIKRVGCRVMRPKGVPTAIRFQPREDRGYPKKKQPEYDNIEHSVLDLCAGVE